VAAFTSERVAALARNGWPLSPGMGGRVGSEYALWAEESAGEDRIREAPDSRLEIAPSFAWRHLRLKTLCLLLGAGFLIEGFRHGDYQEPAH